MKYLDKVLGIKVTYENVEFKHLPNFTAARYRLQMVAMNGQRAIFLYPKTELEQVCLLYTSSQGSPRLLRRCGGGTLRRLRQVRKALSRRLH